MVRFPNEVAVVDAVLFVVAEVLETLLPELEVVSSGVGAGDCAAERVGEKEGRREKRKRKRV